MNCNIFWHIIHIEINWKQWNTRKSCRFSLQRFFWIRLKNAGRALLIGFIFIDILAISERIFLKQSSILFVCCHYASIFIVVSIPTAEIIFYLKRPLTHYWTSPLNYCSISISNALHLFWKSHPKELRKYVANLMMKKRFFCTENKPCAGMSY